MPTLNKTPKQKTKSDNSKDRHKIYDTLKWRKLRLSKLIDSPLCEMCLAKDIITVGVDIHHIISFLSTDDLNKRSDLAFDYNNLQTVCKNCHQKIHNGNKDN